MSRLGTARERNLAQKLKGRSSGSRLGVSSVLFRPITLICLILIGVFAFGALVVLNGFAKDFRKAPPGQATPHSVSAVGYKALSKYFENLDYDVNETRGNRNYNDRDNRLVIYTPSSPTRKLSKLIEGDGDAINLIVLPKWSVGQMRPQKGEESQKGWARKTSKEGLYYESRYSTLLKNIPVTRRLGSPIADATVVFKTQQANPAPNNYKPDFKTLQYFDLNVRWSNFREELLEINRQEREELRKKAAAAKGETYEPQEKKNPKTESAEEKKPAETKPLPEHKVILEIDGHAVLIRLEDTETYILSEPDLVNTMAFNSQNGAQLTNAIIDTVIHNAGAHAMSVDFDVSLHGIEANRNFIKLMVTPPFLAATLCLLTAGGLVGWQGFNRFGDPARVRPDFAQGPISLAQTAAEFMSVANRAHKTGKNYAALIRQQVTTELGYKSRTTDAIDTLLDAREKRLKIQPIFVDIERAIANADTISYGQYAHALIVWRDAMIQSDFPQDP